MIAIIYLVHILYYNKNTNLNLFYKWFKIINKYKIQIQNTNINISVLLFK